MNELNSFAAAYNLLLSLNEDASSTKFNLIIYCDDQSWAKEVFKELNLKRDKKALQAYDAVMKELESKTIDELIKQNVVKKLQSTQANAHEVRWSIGRIQYRIYCFKEGSNLYLLVPFIKNNGDKDTDAAGILAKKRFNQIK